MRIPITNMQKIALVLAVDCACNVSSSKRKRQYILQTHKKSLRIQQHPASAFTAAIKKFDMDRTSTGKQNITSKHHTTLLHTFICRHPHASPEAGTTAPSQHANRCTISEEIPPTQAHTQLSQSAINK
jgi:hypothetical protein